MVTRYLYSGTATDPIIGRWRAETLTLSPGGTRWKKIGVDPVTSLGQPGDAVMCLVKDPDQVIQLQVVVDTTGREDYYVEEFEVKGEAISQLPSEATWVRVLCPTQSATFTNELDNALYVLGYDFKKTGRNVERLREKALRSFQEDNDLRPGVITDETLAHLGMGTIAEYEGK